MACDGAVAVEGVQLCMDACVRVGRCVCVWGGGAGGGGPVKAATS